MGRSPTKHARTIATTSSVALLKATALFHFIALAALLWQRTLGGAEGFELLPLTLLYAVVSLALAFVGFRQSGTGPTWLQGSHALLVVLPIVALFAV